MLRAEIYILELAHVKERCSPGRWAPGGMAGGMGGPGTLGLWSPSEHTVPAPALRDHPGQRQSPEECVRWATLVLRMQVVSTLLIQIQGLPSLSLLIMTPLLEIKSPGKAIYKGDADPALHQSLKDGPLISSPAVQFSDNPEWDQGPHSPLEGLSEQVLGSSATEQPIKYSSSPNPKGVIPSGK